MPPTGQRLLPAAQSHPQVNGAVGLERVQVRVEFAGPAAQGVQAVPHPSTELSATHCMPQRWKPELQVKSQTPLTQAAVAFAGGVHVRHEGPHDEVESATHMLLQ